MFRMFDYLAVKKSHKPEQYRLLEIFMEYQICMHGTRDIKEYCYLRTVNMEYMSQKLCTS